jgi:AraC-like DNA-binding protein
MASVAPHTPYPPDLHPSDHAFTWTEGRTLREFQLVYVARGAGEFSSHFGGTIAIDAGCLVALFPGEWHRYRPDESTGWDEYWVAFDGSSAGTLLADSGLCAGSPVLALPVDSEIVREFRQIVGEIRDEGDGFQEVIVARIGLVLALATARRLRSRERNDNADRIIRRAKEYMAERADRPIGIEQMAAELGVGYSWFRKIFRDATDLSPLQYHLQLRLQSACSLLQSTTHPVGDIAKRLGFDTNQYFAHLFKSKMGCSPSAYRRQRQTAGGI